jgi:hypothetical protein
MLDIQIPHAIKGLAALECFWTRKKIWGFVMRAKMTQKATAPANEGLYGQ